MPDATSKLEFAHKIQDQGHDHLLLANRREQWVEIVEAVLLATVAIATAWRGYQAAKWDALSGRNIAPRASAPILLVLTILFLFQSNSAAQNNSVYETDARPATTSATLVSSSQPFATYHKGNLRDISSVGNRDIGCMRGLGNRYSLKAQDKGRSYAHQVETTFKLITDPVIAEYLNRIGETLAHNSRAQVQLTLKIIDTEEINAFSLPGGFIFVDSGLMLAADNEAELAAVISHEIAHVAACHTGQGMGREEVTNVASMPLIFRLAVRNITLNTVYLRPARSFESEADSLGIEYLYKAGYDPQAMSSILEKIKAIEKQKPGNRANAFESYSLLTDRIERSRKKINTLLPPSPEYKVDTPDFRDVKERLSNMENSHQTEHERRAEMVLR